MKKMRVATIGLAVACLLTVFGANVPGSDGTALSGGGCDKQGPPPVSDADNDGVADDVDNCPAAFNPSQTDEDGNGIGEICESFEPFDGIIECELPACDTNDACFESLEALCPEEGHEASFLGLFFICCDNACITVSSGGDAMCPAGTCGSDSLHCSNDDDCLTAGFGFCFEGCCLPPSECDNGGLAPQCQSADDCAPGESCDDLGCCLPAP